MSRLRVESLEQLKTVCSDGGLKDFVMLSRRTMLRIQMAYSAGESTPWYLHNFVDDSEEDLSDTQLMYETVIGTAIENGAFYQERFDE